MSAKDHERIPRLGAAQSDRRILRTGRKDLAIHEVDEIRLIRHMKVELPLYVAVVQIPSTDKAVRSGGHKDALVSVDPDIKSQMSNRACVSRKNTVEGAIWGKSSRHAIITYWAK